MVTLCSKRSRTDEDCRAFWPYWFIGTAPKNGARVRFSLGTDVNTTLFQVLTPEFGHGTRNQVPGLNLHLGN